MAVDSAEAEALENTNPISDERSAPLLASEAMASLSIGLRLPSQRTREAVTQRLVEMLSSSSSAVSKRYGSLSAEEAAAVARSVEAAAFASAAAADGDGHVSSSVEGGLEILEKYSKEISTRMLEAAKARNPNPSAKPVPRPESRSVDGEQEKETASEASTAD